MGRIDGPTCQEPGTPAARPSARRSSSPFSSIARTGSAYLERVVAGVGLPQVAGQEVYGRLHVLLAHHLVRGVDVAAGDRERDGGDTAVQALDAARVRAAGGQYLGLVRDALALGYSLEVLDEPGVGDRVGVHDLERDPLAQLRYPTLVLRTRHVHRERDVERYHDCRREGGSTGLGAPQTHLLLRGRDRVYRCLVIAQCPHGLDHDEDADAVVHRLAQVVVPDVLQRAVHRYVVADAHRPPDLVCGHAEIHVEILRFGGLLVLVARQVRRLAHGLQGAAQRRAVRRRDDYSLRDHVRRIMSSQGLEPDEAFVVHVPDQEADLVHVRGDHHARVVASSPGADDAAQRVGADLVG